MTLKDVVADPAYAGLHWSIDPDTPLEERETAHVTAAMVAKYLKEHPINRAARPDGPEFLTRDPSRAMWYVRWPNGSVRWETETSLANRRFRLPAHGVLDGERSA